MFTSEKIGGFVFKMESSNLRLKQHLREGDARGRGYVDVCIRIADSLCYTAETNTPL